MTETTVTTENSQSTDLEKAFAPLLTTELQKKYAMPVITSSEHGITIEHLPSTINERNMYDTKIKDVCHQLKDETIKGVFSKGHAWKICISYIFSLRKEKSGKVTLDINFMPTYKTARLLTKVKKDSLSTIQIHQLRQANRIIGSDEQYFTVVERKLSEQEVDEQTKLFAMTCHMRLEKLLDQTIDEAIKKVFSAENIRLLKKDEEAV